LCADRTLRGGETGREDGEALDGAIICRGSKAEKGFIVYFFDAE
jgi:hypothetical protein